MDKIYMILTNGFDPDVRVYKEAKYLVEKGFKVEIICWDRKCEYENNTEENMNGIDIKRFHIHSIPGSGMKQIFPFIKFIRYVRKYLQRKQYTFLHCHDFDGVIVGMFTKQKKRKKIIFDMHEIYKNYSYAKNGVFEKIFNKIIRKCNYIIYVNNEQIENIKDLEENKKVFLPNYPEKRLYYPINKNKSEKCRVNYVGSLRDYESLDTLAKLGINDDNIEVGLYGMGVYYDKLNEKYENTKVKLYGKYNGILDSGEIYRNTDILYCCYNPNIENWKNAYPVKLYESIITLTPIIVSEGTLAGEFVKKYKIGKTVHYNNSASISSAIDELKNNYNNYVENVKIISQNYKWENIVQNLDIIYK